MSRSAPVEADTTILATEVFSAIQGEAALVGERQAFVRLTGCNIRCAYCDQPEALEKRPGPCRVEETPGHRDWRTVDSPLPVGMLVDAVAAQYEVLPHHSVSLTGGEPLMQGAPVTELARRLANDGRLVMLETNGTLVGALERILPWLEYVSMDLKLPSVDGEGVREEVQRTFLARALAGGVTTWVKIVIGAATDHGQFDQAVAMVAELAGSSGSLGPALGAESGPQIFLQPVTPFAGIEHAPTPDQVLELQARALHRYPRVRVVPQTHKAIGQL